MPASKKSLEQFAATTLELEVRGVPLEEIDFDPQNPNEMAPALYEQLKADIRDFGFWQPVLVTPVGDRFRMVDGEHRARIVGELGGTVVPAVIADEWDADEARTRLITMNRFKGDFVPMRMAELLASLAESAGEASIRQRIGMDDAEMRGMLEMAALETDPGEALADDLERERQAAPVVMRFVVKQRDSDLIERVVGAAATGKMDRGQALAAVCREWERAHPTKTKETK
jgi:ParB family chromosome partitioning protein